MTKEVTVWKAVLDGKCLQIAASESFLWKELDRNASYDPAERTRWQIVSERRSVPVVTGTPVVADSWYRDLNSPDSEDLGPPTGKTLKILWQCPVCARRRATDADRGEPGQGIWLCWHDGRHDVICVEWDAEAADREVAGIARD